MMCWSMFKNMHMLLNGIFQVTNNSHVHRSQTMKNTSVDSHKCKLAAKCVHTTKVYSQVRSKYRVITEHCK